ncbi:50S ribosomal protein L10 [Candidatus Kaiserbacteria bacterium RIFCSPHIGHO2_01_FULL_48_10]|uniref:Large ribosomal subunit protein uL10 n=1 Tax=Candidatus Kaiserbacteria bacterium RIFCSPHIGHO2_01_FULL_48_10 TaxID=1798476 RepID=A0A1F6C408_9BACT|nr:MAG: 50S ribosomal protein L10 [Candidatus Kaiserbacteria bacterium RIFCSPHIGHO2_01_FULL_48_10]
MAITKKKKGEILTKISAALKETASVVMVGFKGLTVSEVNALRLELKKEAVKYSVVKKTLLTKALEAQGIEGALPELPGEVAIAYLEKGDDITAPARGLQTFVKKLKEKLVFLGGVLEGKYLSQKEVIVIATIPPTPVLRGMFVNIINSPIQRFAIALNEVAKKKA